MSISIFAELDADEFTLEIRAGKVKLTPDELQTLVSLGKHMLDSAIEDKKIQAMVQKIVRGYSV